jgi:hypothetical protein
VDDREITVTLPLKLEAVQGNSYCSLLSGQSRCRRLPFTDSQISSHSVDVTSNLRLRKGDNGPSPAKPRRYTISVLKHQRTPCPSNSVTCGKFSSSIPYLNTIPISNASFPVARTCFTPKSVQSRSRHAPDLGHLLNAYQLLGYRPATTKALLCMPELPVRNGGES